LREGRGAGGKLKNTSVRSGAACLKSAQSYDVFYEKIAWLPDNIATLRNAPQSVRVSPYGVKILRLASLAHPEANANCFIAVSRKKRTESRVFRVDHTNIVETEQIETWVRIFMTYAWRERARAECREMSCHPCPGKYPEPGWRSLAMEDGNMKVMRS
jgi:hypothetical protein